MSGAANKATSALRILYKTYVRVYLEYCIQAWSTYYIKDIKHLEKIQRRATKLVPGLRNKSYSEHLKCLNLYSLEQHPFELTEMRLGSVG